MISQEQAIEYMQVASLVCMDLDVLLSVAECESLTADQLREHIKMTHGQKQEAIENAEVRQSRYSAASLIFAAVESGMVQCDRVG
jgi:hypothetical protein